MPLTVSRRYGESITVVVPPGAVERTLTFKILINSTDKKLKIQIDAERDIIVDRSEVHEQYQERRKKAKTSQTLQVPKKRD